MQKSVREPRQVRSARMKERILDAAFRLFCEKGYYKTTTNEIARTAGISIGSLYAYFADRETILLEILGRYHGIFTTLSREWLERGAQPDDRRAWLRGLVSGLIAVHEASREFNRELEHVLYYSNRAVAAVLDEQRRETRQAILECLCLYGDDLRVEDREAAAIVTLDFIAALVDRIVFEQAPLERERVLAAGVEAIYKYLFA